jgi:hypothetical protein
MEQQNPSAKNPETGEGEAGAAAAIEKKILRAVEHRPDDRHCEYTFWCPGCKCGHAVWVEKANSLGARWTFNGDMERPTFEPSLLIRWEEWTPPVTAENFEVWKRQPWEQKRMAKVCHSFIRDGKIQFLGDCTHSLAGQTVPMEPF